MSDTPETDAQHAQFAMGGFTMDFCRKLERERDDYMQRFRIALSERDSWKMRADQKYAMRRELEELLGVDRNDASDEQFQKGLDAIKNIIGERDEARRSLEHITEYGTEEINVAVDLRQRLATALVERDEAREALKIKQ
jgi:hypothetical protein